MKYKVQLLLLCVLLAAFLTAAISMPTHAQSVRPGLEIGVSAVSLSYDAGPPFYEKIGIPGWNSRPRASFSLMVFLEVPIGSSLSLQSGLRFSQLGDKASYSTSLGNYAREKRQLYQSIPIRLRYNIHNSPIYVIAGPEFGYLLQARSSYKTPFHYPPGYASNDENFSEYVRRSNVAVGAGIGTSFTFFGKQMYLQVYHNQGITGNIHEPENQGFAVRRIGGYDWRTRETVLNAGYSF